MEMEMERWREVEGWRCRCAPRRRGDEPRTESRVLGRFCGMSRWGTGEEGVGNQLATARLHVSGVGLKFSSGAAAVPRCVELLHALDPRCVLRCSCVKINTIRGFPGFLVD